MKIIRNCVEFQIEEPTAAAIGKFDGLHVGHQKLLAGIFGKKREGLASCIFTFDPPPEVFFGKRAGKELTTREEKRIFFEKMGVDYLIEFPLTKKTAATPPEEFVRKILTKQMQTRFVAAGTDLSFGKNGAGNSELLQKMQAECGFDVKIIDKVCINGREVSSTYVREAVMDGNMELAEELLGEPFTVFGEIVHGNRLGRTIGMPTINQLPPENKLLPPFGVYYSEVEIEGKIYKGITNIGRKPTVNRGETIGVETFLYNFNQDVYGDLAQVRLFSFKRPEQKFADIESLKNQMKADIEAGFHYQHGIRADSFPTKPGVTLTNHDKN